MSLDQWESDGGAITLDEAVLIQSVNFPNVWCLADAQTGEVFKTSIDRDAENGCFAANELFAYATENGYRITQVEAGADTTVIAACCHRHRVPRPRSTASVSPWAVAV